MLYDPKWDKQAEVKADPQSLESFIAWLEKQPAEARYEYDDCLGGCLVGQYMATHKIPWGEFCRTNKWDGFMQLAVYTPRTFGAALERARASLASTEGQKSK